jgi:hypothetical protein
VKAIHIVHCSIMAFVVGCSGPSDPARGSATNAPPDASRGESDPVDSVEPADSVDGGADSQSDVPLDASVEAAPVLGTGTVVANGTVLATGPTGPGVEYFITDAGTFAYYPDASNSLCPIPTTYLCVNFWFALCLNNVYTMTIDPCDFNPDGSIEVWVPPTQ